MSGNYTQKPNVNAFAIHIFSTVYQAKQFYTKAFYICNWQNFCRNWGSEVVHNASAAAK